MGFNVTHGDVDVMLENRAFMDDLVCMAVKNPNVVKKLAENLAESLADRLKGDSEFKKKVIAKLRENSTFKDYLSKEFSEQVD